RCGLVVDDGEDRAARIAERGSAGGSAEVEIDRLVAARNGVVDDRNTDGLTSRIAIGEGDGLGGGRIVRAGCGGAIAGGEGAAHRADAAAAAGDRDRGVAGILSDTVGSRTELHRASGADTKAVTTGKERVAVVGEKSQVVDTRGESGRHRKRAGARG